MGKETKRMARQLKKAFNKQPWYGMSVMAILAEVKPSIVSRRQGKGHSIIELVLHMTSWRKFAAKRLKGDNKFEVSKKENFPRPGSWKRAISGLEKSQDALVQAIKKFPDDRLDELVPSNTTKYTYYSLIHGIIQHDIYHLGQIAYIKKSLE